MSHFAPLARQASLECRLLRMTYTSRGCKHSERTIEVYLANDGYIDAVCRKAEGFRHFRIDRIQAAELLPESFPWNREHYVFLKFTGMVAQNVPPAVPDAQAPPPTRKEDAA